MPDIQLDSVKKDFIKYLDSLGLSPKTHKNYRSDLGHFISWAILRIRSIGPYVQSLTDLVPFLNHNLASEYKSRMIENRVPAKTINRRLSTLRHLSKFLAETETLDFDFTQGLENISSSVKKIQVENPAVTDFKSFLENEKVSPNTIKNYLSDIKHFISFHPSLPNVTPELIKKYQNDLSQNFSEASLKRKSISLRKFLDWAKEKGLIDISLERKITVNDAENFSGKHKARRGFGKWYKEYRNIPGVAYLNIAILVILASALGFGIYTQFVRNASKPLAATTLTRPSRYLSFQGRLTNQYGNPVTAGTSVSFNLYTASTGGSSLWTGTCTISPDSDGVFSTLLGSTCGTELSSSIFSDNATVWLGITVGADIEAIPRIQIATVAYSLNSETLQGYPASASATINTVPVINNSGQMVLAVSSPKIQSTTGNFAIEGQAITIDTPSASNGNITISPDGTGQLNLTFVGASPGSGTGMVNATDANLTSGSLYYGSVASGATGYNLLQLQSGSSPTNKFVVDYAGNATVAGTINGLTAASGIVTGGTWHGTAIGGQYGGTGADNSSAAQYSIPYYSSTGVLGGILAPTTAGYVLSTNSTGGIPSWIPTSATGTNYWKLGSGTVSPFSDTLDVLIGNSATTSADFAFTGVNGGTPTASIAGTTTNVATYLTGNGNLAVTNGAHLTLGGTTTGMIDASNDMNLATGKAYFINGTSVLNNNTLGTGVLTSSLTTVGALASGSIASGFGTIATANTITGTTINGTTGINTGATAGTQRIDSTGNLVSIGNITGTGAVTLTAGGTNTALTLEGQGSGAVNIAGTSTGGVNIAGSGTGDVVVAGGSGSTGCTITNSNGNLVCAGTITGTGGITATALPWSSLTAPTTTLALTMPAADTTTFTESATTQTGFSWTSSTLTSGILGKYSLTGSSAVATAANSGSLLSLTSSTTGFTGATQTLSSIYSSGANTNASAIVQGISSKIVNTGTTSTNIAAYLSASGASTNYALIAANGNVGIGTTSPTALLDVAGNIRSTTGTLQVGNTANDVYSRFGTTATTHGLGSSQDLLIGGDEELNGTLYLNNGQIGNTIGTVTIKLAADPTAVNSYNTLGNGSWMAKNSTNNGIAALIVDQEKGGDIFTASDSGTTRFTITNSGNINIPGLTASLGVYTDASHNLTSTAPSSGQLGYWTRTGTNLYNTNQSAADNVGIGTTSPSYRLEVAGNSSDSYALSVSHTADLASTARYSAIRGSNTLTATSPAASSNLAGIEGVAIDNAASGTLPNSFGIYGSSRNTNTGTVSYASAFESSLLNSGGGTINYGRGLSIQTPSNSSGTITNTYGIYLASQTNGTQTNTPFGIYQAGSSDYNYFAGNVGIGTTSPTGLLSLGTSLGKKLLLYDAGTLSTAYGFGIQSSLLEIIGSSATADFTFGYGTSGSLTRLVTIQGTGEVGIGTTAPGANLVGTYDYPAGVTLLQVDGTQPRLMARGSTDAALDLIDTGGAANEKWVELYNAGGITKFRVLSDTATVQVDNILAIDNTNGDVGIGTSAPGGKLEIGSGQILVPLGAATAGNVSYSFTGDTNTGIFSPGADLISLAAGGNERLRMNSSGDIGIAAQSRIYFDGVTMAGDTYIHETSPNVLQLVSGGIATLNAVSGSVGIGTTTPTALLHVVGSTPASVGTTPGTAATDTMTSVGGTGGTSTAATGVGGTGGDISNTTGAGGVASGATSATGGRAGIFTVTGGTGGAPSSAGTTVGGVGGAMTVSLGAGGGTTSHGTGGAGGAFTTTAGTGGVGNGAPGGGGAGGNVSISAGTGGSAVTGGGSGSSVGGNGGNLYLKGGRGGTGDAAGTEGVIVLQISTGTAAQTTRVNVADGAIILGGGFTSGTTQMDIAGTTTNFAVCHSGVTGATDNVQVVDCGAGPWADYMEMYAFDQSLEYGTIVATGDNYTTTKAGDKIAKLIPSTQPYQSNIIGIVSDPSHINSFNAIGFNIQDGDNSQPLTLNGRVTVGVTSANGVIKAGDPITTSNIPGVGMKATKAGQIIGKALADYNDPDPNVIGKILVFANLSWYDPEVYLTDAGDLNIAKDENGNFSVIRTESTFVKTTVDKIGAFATMVAANIKAGAIITTDLATNSFTAFQGTVDNMLVKSGLVAANIQTKLISPIPGDTNVTVQIGSEATPSGQFVIQNASGSAVASVDNSGNATFSGELAAESATISGTLFADNIKSQSLDDIQALLTKVQTDQNVLKNTVDWSTLSATNSASLDQIAVSNFYVTNQAAINSLSVTNSLAIGPDMVIGSDNTLNSLSAPLKIQSLAMAPVEIMNGLVTIDTKGNVKISGDLFVAGRINSTGLTLKDNQSASPSADLLSLQDASGNVVSSVNSSGSALFNNLTTGGLTIASDNSATTSAVVNGVITTNATAGQGTIPAGVSEITIKNSKVTDYTLVYVTPTSPTNNYVLYIKSKESGQFVVGFTSPIVTDVNFNWWIVQVQN